MKEKMDKLYVIEECLAPGIWVLLSDICYESKEDAVDNQTEINEAMKSFKKQFKTRVKELQKKTD